MSISRHRYKTQAILDEEFKERIRLNPQNKCWEWQPALFRFRHEYHIFNPRRYALQMMGYTIPKGRNVIPGCGNERCVNPEHARMRHNGDHINKGFPLYLDLGQHIEGKTTLDGRKLPDNTNYGHDFSFSNKFLAKKYHVTAIQASKARMDTLKLIVDVKQSLFTIERLATIHKVAPSYIRQIKALTLDQFEEFKAAPNEDFHDEDHINPEGLKFRLD